MPIIPNGGVNENEDATIIAPNVLAVGQGEYRVGRAGFYQAKGRASRSWTAGAVGLYYAGFDNGTDYLVSQTASNYLLGAVGAAMSTALTVSAGTAGTAVVGAHYGNRHYVVNGATNISVESGATTRRMGMARGSVTVGTSLSTTGGSMTVTTGLIYWVTEYDSTRGIESIYGATTASTGVFTGISNVYLSISGTSANPNTNQYRIYRTTDGGAYPDGGLIATVAVGTTFYIDSLATVDSLISPYYGYVSIGGLPFERDVMPPTMYAIGGPFEDSLVGIPISDRRSVRFSYPGYPESWPSVYDIPLQTERHDVGMGLAYSNGFLGAFTRDCVFRISRLPRDTDSAFAAGEALTTVTKERGLISKTGLATFTMPGQSELIAFVARDGVFATNLDSVLPLTDTVNWQSRVNISLLSQAVLANDPARRRMVLVYPKAGSTTNNGVMYLDYQLGGVRVTHPDHGALTGLALGIYSGGLYLFSCSTAGAIYTEAIQDKDDSNFTNSSGGVPFRMKTSQSLAGGGAFDDADLGDVSYMHDAGPATVEHYHYFDRNATPHHKTVSFSERGATEVGLTRRVNAVQLELYAVSTSSWGLHWFDVDGLYNADIQSKEGL